MIEEVSNVSKTAAHLRMLCDQLTIWSPCYSRLYLIDIRFGILRIVIEEVFFGMESIFPTI